MFRSFFIFTKLPSGSSLTRFALGSSAILMIIKSLQKYLTKMKIVRVCFVGVLNQHEELRLLRVATEKRMLNSKASFKL